MGFKDPTFPAVDPQEFLASPLRDRIKILTGQWAGYGFGAPKLVNVIYLMKLFVFYGFFGVCIATFTSDLEFWHVSDWWNQPIVYQKLIMWTLLVETIGIGGSWGPLAGKAKPMTGGIQFWTKRNTIRLRPWKAVPFTNGTRRTPVDIGIYVLLLISYVVPMVLPGIQISDFAVTLERLGLDSSHGLINPAYLVAPIVLLVLMGLRDKVIFLAARGEQYFPALLAFAILPTISMDHGFTNMMIALKLLIGVVWVGAGISKLNAHFTFVIPPMLSNAPSNPFAGIRRAMYKSYPEDLRPSGLAKFMAHGLGALVEIAAPLVLLFSTNWTVTLVAGILMIAYHLFIISSFPLAVPLEWNLLFSYAVLILFLGFPNNDGFAPWNMTPGWLAIIVAAGLMFFPILGNLRPDLVSFLSSMRQYAGNWASGIWAFAPGAEEKLNRVTRSAPNQIDQFIAAGYPPDWAEVTLQMTIGWRALHSQGRGLFSVLHSVAPDVDQRTVREAEFLCNSLLGWNFGDGHMHREDMIQAVQDEAGFEPGDVLIVWVESQPIHKSFQQYKVIDPALGVVEEGTWEVADLIEEQPWLPNGPARHSVSWSNLRSQRTSGQSA